jgi:hypothetical protein
MICRTIPQEDAGKETSLLILEFSSVTIAVPIVCAIPIVSDMVVVLADCGPHCSTTKRPEQRSTKTMTATGLGWVTIPCSHSQSCPSRHISYIATSKKRPQSNG